MNTSKNAMIAICLTAILAFAPLAGFAQAATTFSGEAVALRANALGISLSLSDTGPLPSSGGNLSTSVASVNVLGLASADALRSTSSGSGASSQSQSLVANLNLLGGLITADVVQSNSSATCSGSQASVSCRRRPIKPNVGKAGQHCYLLTGFSILWGPFRLSDSAASSAIRVYHCELEGFYAKKGRPGIPFPIGFSILTLMRIIFSTHSGIP